MDNKVTADRKLRERLTITDEPNCLQQCASTDVLVDDNNFEKMTDIQLLIASPFGIVAFYFVMKYFFVVAAKAKPETGTRMRKSLKTLIILYAIGMTVQLIYLVDKIFFN